MKNPLLKGFALTAVFCFAAAVSEAQITNGLVVHLTFDGTNAMGNYTNSIANGIDAVPVGAPYAVSGKIGGAVAVSSDSSLPIAFNYLSLGYPAELQFGGVADGTATDFSIAFWCNYTNQSSDPCFIASQNWNSSNNQGWGIYMQGGGGERIVAAQPRTQISNPAGGLLRDGTWHHVTVTFERLGNMSFYRDGVLVAATSMAGTTGNIDTAGISYNVNIGQDGTGGYVAKIIDLFLDDMGIWRRVLSPGEVQAIYIAGLGGTNLSKVPAIVNPYVKTLTPAPQSAGVVPNTPVGALITDGLNAVVPSSVKLLVNGVQVAASVNKSGTDTTVQFTPTVPWPAGDCTATLIFANNASPQQSFTNTWAFGVAPYVTLTTDLKVTADTSKPGFRWNIFANQASAAASNARAEAALAGLLLDIDGVTPLPNNADPAAQGVALAPATPPNPTNAVLKFEIPGVINIDSYAGFNGNFAPDGQMPGMPETDFSTDGAAAEAITYIDLPAGLITMGINSDDGFRTTVGRPPLGATGGMVAGEFDGARSSSDTLFYLNVKEAGVYGFRTLWENATGSANIEWFTVNGTNKVLVNDTANGGLRAYRALTTPNPPYVQYISPLPVPRQVHDPSTNIVIVLSDGDTALDDTSVVLRLDGTVVTPVKTRSGSKLSLTYTPTGIQFPADPHLAELTYRNTAGTYTNTQRWSFCNLKNIVLPAPVIVENFDSYAEGSVPTGWVEKNFTDCSGDFCTTPGLDLNNLNSDSYRGWVVVDRGRLAALKSRIFNVAPNQFSNGVPVTLDDLCTGNLIYAESDVRDGNQVQFLTSKAFDLSNVANPAIAFGSLYEQNQDSLGAVEYSVDGGSTWLPVVYYLDYLDTGGDIRLNADGTVDAVKTFTDPNLDTAVWTDNGVAKGGKYGDGIAAPITQALGHFIAPRANDDPISDKRLEIYRLPVAARKSDVRLRFAQLGTGSWYFGVDNLRFYDVTAPPVSRLTMIPSGANVTLFWTGIGTLQQAPTVTGPWTPVGSQANPQTQPLGSTANYWRIGPP